MGQIFISYARDDDEPFVKQLYQDLTENGIDVWWDRKDMESRGRTFLQELRDAIEASDCLIAVIGPTAVTSDYVKAEWEHALLFAKGVVPILRINDYHQIPSNLSKFHCPDFRKERPYNEALEELLDILAKPVPKLGPLLTAVPSLPPHFLPRFDEIVRLGENVLVDIQRPTVITSAEQTTALQGMWGVGKSVLAAAFARATDTRRAFDNGIVWITIGQRSDPLMNMKVLGLAFDDDPGNYTDIEIAMAHLPKVLADKVCLIVLDDVWNVVDVTPFRNALGPRCRLLITTREGGLITALGAQEHRLDVLTDEAARRFLGNWCGVEVASLPSEAVSVAKECGNLPFALALCGAMAKDETPWSDMLEALQEADLIFIEKQFPNYPYPDMLKSLKVSLDLLARENPEAAKHYHELVIFPVDETIPEVAVMTLWHFTNGLKERNARKLLTLLEGKVLLRLEGKAPNRLVSLHDLQHDYLRAVMGDLSSLHGLLLEAYQQECKNGWQNGPNDGYYFEHLAYHLIEAGRKEEFHKLLFSFVWLQAKLEATNVNFLISDYDYFQNDSNLRLIQSAIRLSAYILMHRPQELASQLLGRLQLFQELEIQSMLEQACTSKECMWLHPLTASLTPPGGPLIRTLKGVTGFIYAVLVTQDGRCVISASDSNYVMIQVLDMETGVLIRTLKWNIDAVDTACVTPDGRRAISSPTYKNEFDVWDMETGALIRTLKGHTKSVKAVCVTPDSRCVIVASDDNMLKVWDLDTGEEIRKLKGHTESVTAVSVTLDGRCVIVAPDDNMLKVWDIDTGEEIRKLKGHTECVTAVSVTPDGKRAISASHDNTLKVWDMDIGEEIRTLKEHTESVKAVCITPDGKRAISVSYDKTLKVWDLDTGEEICTLLKEHTFLGVTAICVTPDGRRAISASDHTLKVWDLEIRKDIRELKGHTESVTAVCVTPDDRRAISASHDHTLRVWDMDTGEEIRALKGHTKSVTAVSVTPDGKRAISASHDKTLKVWDMDTGKEIRALKGHTESVTAISVTPDGKRAISVSYDKTFKVWDLDTGEEIHTLHGITLFSVTPDSRRAFTSYDDTLKVWDIDTGALICTWWGHNERINAISVTSDSKHAISASDSTLKIWDVETGKMIRILRWYDIVNTFIFGLSNNTLKIWDRETGARIDDSIPGCHEATAICVTPDGRHIISASNESLIVWDMETGVPIHILKGHVPITYITVTPDSRRVIFGSTDIALKIWDIVSAKILASFSGESRLATCAISHDGKTIVAGEDSGRVHFLRLVGVE